MSKGLTEVIRIHSLRSINICTNFKAIRLIIVQVFQSGSKWGPIGPILRVLPPWDSKKL